MSPFMLLFPLSASMESSINMLSKNIYFYTNIMNIYHAEEDLKTYPRNLMCILKNVSQKTGNSEHNNPNND